MNEADEISQILEHIRGELKHNSTYPSAIMQQQDSKTQFFMYDNISKQIFCNIQCNATDIIIEYAIIDRPETSIEDLNFISSTFEISNPTSIDEALKCIKEIFNE